MSNDSWFEQVHVPAGDVLRGPAGQRAHHRVGHEDVAVEVDERLGDRGREEEGLEQLTAVGEQRVDGPHAVTGGPGGARTATVRSRLPTRVVPGRR